MTKLFDHIMKVNAKNSQTRQRSLGLEIYFIAILQLKVDRADASFKLLKSYANPMVEAWYDIISSSWY